LRIIEIAGFRYKRRGELLLWAAFKFGCFERYLMMSLKLKLCAIDKLNLSRGG
jgi:hypothetical protein